MDRDFSFPEYSGHLGVLHPATQWPASLDEAGVFVATHQNSACAGTAPLSPGKNAGFPLERECKSGQRVLTILQSLKTAEGCRD